MLTGEKEDVSSAEEKATKLLNVMSIDNMEEDAQDLDQAATMHRQDTDLEETLSAQEMTEANGLENQEDIAETEVTLETEGEEEIEEAHLEETDHCLRTAKVETIEAKEIIDSHQDHPVTEDLEDQPVSPDLVEATEVVEVDPQEEVENRVHQEEEEMAVEISNQFNPLVEKSEMNLDQDPENTLKDLEDSAMKTKSLDRAEKEVLVIKD